MPRAQQTGLKPAHKLVQAYYAALAQFHQHHVTRETAVRQPFLDLLRAAAGQRGWSLEPEFPMQGSRGHRIVVDDYLTLEGIPPETYEYRLGNRSALEWVIDQYQVGTDKRSGITNDPNRPDDPQYIVHLIAQVITVSLETMKIVKSLPPI
jgi:predicted helicase